MVGSQDTPLEGPLGTTAWKDGFPDPDAHPDYFDGIVGKRMVAYVIDLLIITLLIVVVWVAGSVLSVLTFGLFFPVKVILLALIPLAYHGLLVARPRAATIGMEKMGIEVRRLDGGRPGYLQAFLMALMFYGTVSMTWFLVLFVAFLNGRRRCVHDFLSGVMVVNRIAPPDNSIKELSDLSRTPS